MNDAQLRVRALTWLVEYTGLVVPHGVITEAMQQAMAAFDQWDAFEWPDDPDASPKPTWRRIKSATIYVRREINFEAFEFAARTHVSALINSVYGATSDQDELFKRLRGETSPAQDSLRDAYRAKYRWLMDSDKPYTETFDPAMLD